MSYLLEIRHGIEFVFMIKGYEMTNFFTFNQEKSIETVIYLASRAKDPTKMSILKLIYFADKTSLEKYGQFITGDRYSAMKHGPVASNIYNLMKLDSETLGTLGFRFDGHKLIPSRDADLSKLSDSDIECLDNIIALYGQRPAWDLSAQTHQDPAWRKNWGERTADNTSVPIPLEDILDTFDEGEELLEYLRENTHITQ